MKIKVIKKWERWVVQINYKHQTFYYKTPCGHWTKADALWSAKMLRAMFRNYKNDLINKK